MVDLPQRLTASSYPKNHRVGCVLTGGWTWLEGEHHISALLRL